MKVKIVIKKDIEINLNDLYSLLRKYDVLIDDDIMNVDLIISFGGDGTILSLIKYLKKKNVKVFSINYGNIGYMTKFNKENYLYGLEEYFKNNYKVEKREFLEIKFNDKIYYALNELSILKCGINSRMIEVIAYQEKNLINRYKGDGIIICTPTGSTAYSLSSNGPIITNDVKCICITPLAQQSLSGRSIVLSPNKKLYFYAKSHDRKVGINIDGNFYENLEENMKIEVILSELTINLIEVFEYNYFDILRQKLHWS